MSIEFMFMVISALMIVVGFLYIFSEYYKDTLAEKKQTVLYDYGVNLQREFLLAEEAGKGYRRGFTLPENVDGFRFTVFLEANTLMLNYSEAILYFSIPNTTGNLTQGYNLIHNEEGQLTLN